MQQPQVSVSKENVMQAFRVVSNPTNSSESIKAANEYLSQCEKAPGFSLMLIQLYSCTSEAAVQLQSILLLLNIIKRNWQTKRGRRPDQNNSFETQKQQIRKQLIAIYPLHDLRHVKHINQALKFLARQDYPAKYLELHQFMLGSLRTLYQTVLTSQAFIKQQKSLIIGFLSTVKIISKEYASKRLSHSQEAFNLYISQLIKVSLPISEKCHKMIVGMWQGSNNNPASTDIQVLQVLIQSGKKIDKIILYCLLCMPNSLQYVLQVQKIFTMTLDNISVVNNFITQQSQNPLKQKLSANLQSYIAGVLQQVFKVQSLYPFLLVDVLENYLHMIVKMLVQNVPHKAYKNQRLILTIVQANLKIFTCFTYYMSCQEFQGSIYNRKQSNNLQLQQKLHQQFITVFSQENTTQLLSQLITEVMVSKAINPELKDIVDQEMVLEETEVGSQDTLAESNAYELCVLLCKNVLKCFKKQLKPVLESLFLSVGQFNTQNNAKNQKVIENTMQLILVLPKIYQQHELPLSHVMNLLQVLYANHQYAMLARLIKNYQEYLDQGTLQNSFSILSQIVSTPLSSPHVTVDIIYQSALTMKKILTENESDLFSFQNFSSCVVNLLQVLHDEKFTKTPTLMWPLIKLANQLLKLTNTNAVIERIGQEIVDCLYPITQAKQGQQLTVCGIAEILQQLLNIVCGCFKTSYMSEQSNSSTITKSTIKVLYASYSLIVNNVSNSNLQNVDSLYMLWLHLIRNYPTAQQQLINNMTTIPEIVTLNTNMEQLFGHLFETVLEEDSICAIQVLEEYVICGIVKMTQSQLVNVFEKLLNNCVEEHKVRTYTALFSMYYCYLMVQAQTDPQAGLQTDILKLLIQTLIQYVNQISPQINGLRTLIMLILNYCVLKFGVQNIYQLFNSFYQDNYAAWFMAYCWSSHKVNSAAYLNAIKQLGVAIFGKMLQTPIEENYPLDTVLKVMIISLEPIKISQAWITFSNMYKLILPTETSPPALGILSDYGTVSSTSRKIKLQLSGLLKQILISDQRQAYQTLMTQLFTFWDWGEDDINERFDKITSGEIISLLKGNFNKDYDINEPD